MRKFFARAMAAGCALLLSACGGGGGGVQPNPIAAPPPPPPPSMPLTSSATFPTISTTRWYKVDPDTGVVLPIGMVSEGRGTAVTIAYDAANKSYTVSNGQVSATLGAADRTISGNLDIYAKQNGLIVDQLTLYNNVRVGTSQAGSPVKLTYMSYGLWEHSDHNQILDPNSAAGDRKQSYFLFGYPTDADMPRTGSATYSTAVTGTEEAFLGNGRSDLTGSATFSADFGAGTVSTDLTLASAANQNPIGTFNGTGTISADQFNGTFTSNAFAFLGGAFAGGFFGPKAEEMGYTFWLMRENRDPYACASINCPIMMDWISGAVVGKKQ